MLILIIFTYLCFVKLSNAATMYIYMLICTYIVFLFKNIICNNKIDIMKMIN